MQLLQVSIQLEGDLGSRGCLNGDPGTPTPAVNTPQTPLACQAYWNQWYVGAVGHCNASNGGNACIDQANTAVKNGLAACGGQTSPMLQGQVSNTPGEDTYPESPGELPLPPNVRQGLLDSAAKMDQIANDTQEFALAATNHFFKCLTESLSADAKFLAQPGYVPAAQMAQALHDGVTGYFLNNAVDNNLQIYGAAQRSLNSLWQDPACALANIVPTVATVAVTHLSGAVAEANAVQDAANDAIKIAEANAADDAAWQNGPAKVGAPPVNKFNPTCAPNMCFPSAVAQDLTWETGEPLSAQPFAGNVMVQIVKGVPTKVYNLTTNKTMQALLRGLYGGKKLLEPVLDSARTVNQLDGIYTEMSQTDIVNELRAAGSGARGIVVIEYPPDADGNVIGHAVNARNFQGSVFTIDASNGGIDASPMYQRATKYWFYRTN